VSTLHVAPADQLDAATLYAILRLRSDVFIVEQECAYADVDGLDLLSSTRHLWLTGDGPRPIAYLRLLAEPDGTTVRIGRVCVSPDARRRGLAAQLMAAALEIVDDHPSVLSAQVYAADLYAAAGFVAEGDEYLEDDIPHVTMRRPGRISDTA
jgi:ElaA protein